MGRHRVVYGGYIYTDLDGWTKNSLQLGVLILWQLTNINVINNLWVASCSSTKMVMETTRCIIFMYVCMYVCLSVCMYVWMYGCMYVCMYIFRTTHTVLPPVIYPNLILAPLHDDLVSRESNLWSCCPSLCQRWKFRMEFPHGFRHIP